VPGFIFFDITNQQGKAELNAMPICLLQGEGKKSELKLMAYIGQIPDNLENTEPKGGRSKSRATKRHM
jgi:hypothetical protein